MSRQRILALVTDAFGGYGGIAQYNRDLMSALAQMPGVDRIDVLPRLAGDGFERPASLIHQYHPVQSRAAFSASALSLAVKHRPTIVFNGHLYLGPLAETVARIAGARLVNQLHGTEIWRPISALHRTALERSDLVLAVSRDTRARVLAGADLEPEKVVVLNNTVGDDFTPGDRRAARARWGVADDIMILTVARLDDREGYKGHDRVISLIAQLRSEGLPVSYLIAGTGDDQPRLQALAKSSGVAAHIRFLGMAPREALPDLYRAADLFALPSTGEGFGIAFLEAMACGTPSIGLAVGGAPDALADGELGICVSAEAFPDALKQAVRSPRPGSKDLSERVRIRFGQATFRVRVAETFASFEGHSPLPAYVA